MRNFKINKFIVLLTFSILPAYILTSLIYILLPKYGVDKPIEPPFKIRNSYRIASYFIINKKPKKRIIKKKKKVEKVYSLKKWKLRAVYISQSESFILLEDKRKKNIISLLEKYKGYQLIDVNSEEAIFERAKKSYSLKLEKENKKLSSLIDNKRPPEVEIERKFDPETNEISSASVKRKDLQYYLNNVSQIWRNIKIQPYRENRAIVGFKVNYVKRGSVFESLGLQAGDIITAIDGSPIRSYAQVQRYYKNIKKIKNLNLTILRNGEEKEINYDIQ